MFLKPPLSTVSVIYILPFSETVWITFVVVLAILTFGQEASNRLYKKVNKSERGEPTEWSEAILNSIGIVCEQGDNIICCFIPIIVMSCDRRMQR